MSGPAKRKTRAGHPQACNGKSHTIRDLKRKPVSFHPRSRPEVEQLIDDLLEAKPHLKQLPRPVPFVSTVGGGLCYASDGHVLLGEPCVLPQSPTEPIVLCNIAYQRPGFTTHYATNKQKKLPPQPTPPPPPPEVGDKRPQVHCSLVQWGMLYVLCM